MFPLFQEDLFAYKTTIFADATTKTKIIVFTKIIIIINSVLRNMHPVLIIVIAGDRPRRRQQPHLHCLPLRLHDGSSFIIAIADSTIHATRHADFVVAAAFTTNCVNCLLHPLPSRFVAMAIATAATAAAAAAITVHERVMESSSSIATAVIHERGGHERRRSLRQNDPDKGISSNTNISSSKSSYNWSG
jgi:hypothetical protein